MTENKRLEGLIGRREFAELSSWVREFGGYVTDFAYYHIYLDVKFDTDATHEQVLELFDVAGVSQCDQEIYGVKFSPIEEYFHLRVDRGVGHDDVMGFFGARDLAYQLGWPGVISAYDSHVDGEYIRRLSNFYHRYGDGELALLDLPERQKKKLCYPDYKTNWYRYYLRSRVCLFIRLLEIGVPSDLAEYYVERRKVNRGHWMLGGQLRDAEFYLGSVRGMKHREFR